MKLESASMISESKQINSVNNTNLEFGISFIACKRLLIIILQLE